jgi:hypothetical protein
MKSAGQRCRRLILPVLLLATAMASTVWWQVPWLPGRFTGQAQAFVPVTVADILLALTTLISLTTWSRRGRRPSLRPLGLSLPILAVVGLAIGGAPHAPDQPLALAVAGHLVLLALLYTTCASGVVAPSVVAAALVLGLAVQVPLAIEQVVRQTTTPLGFLLAWPGDYTATTPDASVLLATGGVRWLRAYGPFDHPNILGGYLALELPLLIGILLAERPRLSARFSPLLLGLPIGLVLTGLALAASRGAWLGAIAGLVAMGVAFRRPPGERGTPWLRSRRIAAGVLAIAGLTLVVALLMLRPPLGGRLAPDSNRLEVQSVQERLFFDQVGLQLLLAHPLFGVGAGNVDLAETRFFHQAFGPAPMHDVPLLMAVELGAGGALAWAVAAGYIAVQTWRHPGRWTVPFGASLVAIGVAGLFDHYFWTFPVAGTTAAIVAGGWAAAWNAERRARSL